MTFAYLMLLTAALLPYMTVAFAKAGGVDNRQPRVGLEQLTGWCRRVDWAHRNHFEAFAPFAAAVILAHSAGVTPTTVNLLAGMFVATRIGYTAAYVADRATLRSLICAAGLACVIALFALAAVASAG